MNVWTEVMRARIGRLVGGGFYGGLCGTGGCLVGVVYVLQLSCPGRTMYV